VVQIQVKDGGRLDQQVGIPTVWLGFEVIFGCTFVSLQASWVSSMLE